MAVVTAENTISVTAASGLFLAANARVRALLITSPGSSAIYITTLATAVVGTGLTIRPNTPPTLLTYENCGDWIQRQLMAISAATTESIGALQVMQS